MSDYKSVNTTTTSSSTDYDYLFKILIIGESGTGKSSIMLRYTDGTYSDSYISTIGVDFKIRTIKLPNSKIVKLQIWDTAGQERFRTITTSYYRGAQAIMIVFDITCLESLTNLGKYVEDVIKYSDKKPIIQLLGNKMDLEHDNNNKRRLHSVTTTTTTTIEQKDINDFLNNLNSKQVARNLVKYHPVSAKTNTGINEAFLSLVDECCQAFLSSAAISIQQQQQLQQNAGDKNKKKLITSDYHHRHVRLDDNDGGGNNGFWSSCCNIS